MSVPSQLTSARLAVGMMTGTSIDGIDASLVRLEGVGLAMQAQLVRHLSRPLGNIGTRLRNVAEKQPMTAGEFARLAWDFGGMHAEVIAELDPGLSLDFVCIHGQTVFHQPPISWQLVNPAPIAARFNCPVVSDLRQADLAAGGQGAPITPLADWILFQDSCKSRAVVNLGGFCNITVLPASTNPASRRVLATGSNTSMEPPDLSKIQGFDVCACNQILDAAARKALAKAFDQDGVQALRGLAKPQAAAQLLEILECQRREKRSLGTGDEAMQWVDHQIQSKISAADLLATAVDAVARCISAAVCDQNVDEIILAGGGARNLALFEVIRKTIPKPVILSDERGVPIEARESMAFAILGGLCADRVPITLPQVTGCRFPAPISGNWSGAPSNATADSRSVANDVN